MVASPRMKFAEVFADRRGNFAMLAALAAPVIFIAASLAVDTTNTLSMKTRVQNAVDSAALATATRLSQEDDLSLDDARDFAATFLRGQVQEDLAGFDGLSVVPFVTITPVKDSGKTIWKVAITATGTRTLTPMARLMGQDTVSVDVVGKSESASGGAVLGALSMALVLDRSGSMDWDLDGQRKIDVLKTAVGGLLDQFETADPGHSYVRVGAASYNTRMTGSQAMHWKPRKTREFVNALPAEGGTDSTEAFDWAYTNVDAPMEIKRHEQKSGQVPERFIVFMTDGDNNYSAADSSTRILCDKARDAGVKVYSVAFAAPTRGKQLLQYCATSEAHFFDARSSADLIAAFKSIGKQASKVVSRLTE